MSADRRSAADTIKDDPVVNRFRLIYCLVGVATIACGIIVLYESLHPSDVNTSWCKQDTTNVTFGIGWQLSCALTFTICLVVALGVFEMVKGDWSLLGTYTVILLVLTVLQLVFAIYFSAVDDFNCFAVGVTPWLLVIFMFLLLVVLYYVARRLSIVILGGDENESADYAPLAPERAKKFAAVEVNKNAFRSFWSAPVQEIGGRMEVNSSSPSTSTTSAAIQADEPSAVAPVATV